MIENFPEKFSAFMNKDGSSNNFRYGFKRNLAIQVKPKFSEKKVATQEALVIRVQNSHNIFLANIAMVRLLHYPIVYLN